MNIQKELELFSSIFEYHEKTEDREAFYSFSMEAMKQESELYPYYRAISNAMREIQTDEDTLYSQAKECIDWICDDITGDIESIDEIEAMDLHEGIDGSVDVYTSGLTEWLNRSNYNVYYLEQAQSEFGATGSGCQTLATAQYCCHSEIWHAMQSAIINFLREVEDEENED